MLTCWCFLWGRLADRIGRPLMITVGILVALTPLLWLEARTTEIFLWVWFPLLHIERRCDERRRSTCAVAIWWSRWHRYAISRFILLLRRRFLRALGQSESPLVALSRLWLILVACQRCLLSQPSCGCLPCCPWCLFTSSVLCLWVS